MKANSVLQNVILVNCAILAMLDAGIQMHHVAAGGTVALLASTVDEKKTLDLIGKGFKFLLFSYL